MTEKQTLNDVTATLRLPRHLLVYLVHLVDCSPALLSSPYLSASVTLAACFHRGTLSVSNRLQSGYGWKKWWSI